MEQFVESLSFQFKEIGEFRFQSIWKTLFYVLVLVLLAGTITGVFKIIQANEIKLELEQLPNYYYMKKNGTSFLPEAVVIPLPQIETLIVIGSTETDDIQANGLKNIVVLEPDSWFLGRIGYSPYEMSYADFPFLAGQQEQLSKQDLVSFASDLDEQIKRFAPLYHYVSTLIDLVFHLVLISLLALAGRSYRRVVNLTYKQIWNVTAYGITAPILVRTLIHLLGLAINFLPMLYWLSVALFSIQVIRNIEP